jgi:hypothetical protein
VVEGALAGEQAVVALVGVEEEPEQAVVLVPGQAVAAGQGLALARVQG